MPNPVHSHRLIRAVEAELVLADETGGRMIQYGLSVYGVAAPRTLWYPDIGCDKANRAVFRSGHEF